MCNNVKLYLTSESRRFLPVLFLCVTHQLDWSTPGQSAPAMFAASQWECGLVRWQLMSAAVPRGSESEAESAILFVFVSVLTGSEGETRDDVTRWAEIGVTGEMTNQRATERRGAGRAVFIFTRFTQYFISPGWRHEKLNETKFKFKKRLNTLANNWFFVISVLFSNNVLIVVKLEF